MKNKNKVLYICFLFIGIIIFLICSTNKCLKETETMIEKYSSLVSECHEILESSNETNENYLNCQAFLKSYNEKENFNFFIVLSNVIMNSVNSIAIVMILIIDFFAIIWVNKILKNKYIVNYYTRTSNKKFLKKLLSESYIYIVPIILAFVIFLVYTFMNTNLVFSDNVIEASNWSINTMKRPFEFIILYIIHLALFLGTYINLGLIMSRKNYNYVLSLISTFLLFIGLELFDELIIDRILKFKYSSYFSIVNCFAFDDRLGMLSPLLFPLVAFFITLILVVCLYKNKEKLYLDCENKNNW